jgi:endogenous inhibitor of DNA gyrase (YacG/DUF329 family)
MSNKKNIINCPACGKQNTWIPENKNRPFCSPRCKLIDLGDWASEQHRIAGAPVVLEDTIPTDELENKKDQST